MVNKGSFFVSENTDVSVYENVSNLNGANINNNGNLYLFKNVENFGSFNFDSNKVSGTTLFTGEEVQTISGNGLYNLFDVEINNISTNFFSIELSSPLDIFGETYFEDGVVNEFDAGIFNFKEYAQTVNVSDASYGNNRASKKGSSEFTFPLGDYKDETYLYRPAKISAPENETDEFYAEYNWKNTDILFNHSSKQETISVINAVEYWNIERTVGESNVKVTLTWNDITTPSLFLNDLQKMVIVRWDGEKWINEGGIINANTQEISSDVSGYGIFTFGLLNSANILDPTINIQEITNSFSPNEDGTNDTFQIPGLAEDYPNFKMTIYNRYGNIVYDYQNNGKTIPLWWDGRSYGRMTVGGNKNILPTATYWYVVDFNDGRTKPYQSWLYLNN
tara:strand:- start:1420 stop:2595 length:1176 start_codon:yes stop_codon:yes gene_type:complete